MRESNETSTTPWNLTLSVPLPFCTFQSPTQRRKKSFDVRQPNPCTLRTASQTSVIICLYSRHFVIYRGLLLNESGKWCIMHNIDVWHPNRCIPDEIDLFYFKTCIITHNNNVIEQNINVSMFDILSVKEPHKFCLWYKFANSPIGFWNRLNPTFTMAGHFFWHPTSATGTTTPPNTEIWSMSGAICKIIDIFWRLEDIGTRQNKINFIFWVWKLVTPHVTWNVFLTTT